jgi:hypothetical protein
VFLESNNFHAYGVILDIVILIHDHSGFKITKILYDNEFQLIMKNVYSIRMSYASMKEHISDIETIIQVFFVFKEQHVEIVQRA